MRTFSGIEIELGKNWFRASSSLVLKQLGQGFSSVWAKFNLGLPAFVEEVLDQHKVMVAIAPGTCSAYELINGSGMDLTCYNPKDSDDALVACVKVPYLFVTAVALS